MKSQDRFMPVCFWLVTANNTCTFQLKPTAVLVSKVWVTGRKRGHEEGYRGVRIKRLLSSVSVHMCLDLVCDMIDHRFEKPPWTYTVPCIWWRQIKSSSQVANHRGYSLSTFAEAFACVHLGSISTTTEIFYTQFVSSSITSGDKVS